MSSISAIVTAEQIDEDGEPTTFRLEVMGSEGYD